MTKRRKITRRTVIGTGMLAPIPAWARGLARSGVGSMGPPSITGVFINGSSTATTFQASTANAPVGLITATTSDSSNPTINITGNSEGFHPTSGTAGSMTLLAPAGGLSAGPYTDVTITASGAYSNSPHSINPTLTAAATQAFVTGQTFAGSPASVGDGPQSLTGMQVLVGSSALTVTALGRWTVPGNSMTHTLSILDGVHMLQVGPSVTVNCSGAPTSAFLYGTLSTPVTLLAGRAYFIVSSEIQGSPGSADFVYRQDSGSTYTTTGDGTLAGGVERNVGSNTQWYVGSNPGMMNGPLNFQYTVTPGALATLGGTPFANFGRISSAIINLPTVAVVSGTITMDMQNFYDYYGGPWLNPPANSMVAQWWVDGAPASSQITGPQNQAGGVYFPWTFDTHTLTDGTHAVFLQVVDSGASAGPGYYYISGGENLIVQNTGPMNGAQTIPVMSKAQFEMIYPSMPDFVHYNGDPTRTVNFFDYPMPFCPPITNSANPFFGTGFASQVALGQFQNWYSAQLLFQKFHEYENDRSICTTYPSGGVCTTTFNPNQTTNDASYPGVLNTFAWDGRRYDARVSPYSTWVGDPVPPSGHAGLRNASVPGGYYETQGFSGIELAGAVRHVELNGNVVTMAGLILNRTSELVLEEGNANNLLAMGNQAPLLAKYQTIGTMSGFTQWGGLNDLCYDGRFADGHILYVCNQAQHTIIEVDVSTSPATCTRIAGIEGAAGYTGDGGAATSATLDTPYSLISGSDGILYICDLNNSAIRIVDVPGILGTAGHIYTLLGNQSNKPSSALTVVSAMITASISGVTMTVSVVTGGTIYVGATVTGTGVQYDGIGPSLNRQNTVVSANGTGTGGAGTYSVYVPQYFTGTVAFFSGATQVATATAVICDALGASFQRPGTIMTVSGVTGTISVGNTVQSTGTLTGVFLNNTTVIASLGGSQYTVSPTQTVSSTAMTLYSPSATTADSAVINGVFVNWNPTTTSPVSFTRGANTGPLSSGPYAPFPTTIRFASGSTAFASARIVLFQNESKSCRLIDMAAQTVSLMFFMTTADIQWGQRGAGAFAFMDVDANSTCGPANQIGIAHNGFELAFFSFDGTQQQQWYGNPSTFQWQDVMYGTGLFDGPLVDSSVVFAALAGYTWGITFHKSQCIFLTMGFQRIGLDLWRVRLSSDPGGGFSATAASLVDEQSFAFGFLVWNWGSHLAFPRNSRPGIGVLHGFNSFGHLGSDIAPTAHDMCVIYNGGSADYTSPNITVPIATMVASGTTIAITLTGGNNAFISGVTGLNGQYVMISGATNTGSGGNSAVNGFFKVSNYTDSQHFSVTVPVAPGSGTITPGVLNYGDAVLLAYIHAGAGGVVPRPEWDIAGNDWRDLSYYIRRQTTAGSYPTIAAIGPANADLDPPLVTSCSAVRNSSTSITVSWVTNKDTIGLACASSSANYATGIGFVVSFIRNAHFTTPYGCWSELEPAFLAGGVTHSMTIPWCPPSSPTHFSVVVKDRAGNYSFAQDQTIA